MTHQHTIESVASYIGGSVEGNAEYIIDSFATIQTAGEHQLTFIANLKYKKYLQSSKAGAIIISKDLASLFHGHKIIVEDVYTAYAKAVKLIYATTTVMKQQIASSAVLDPALILPESISIAHGVTIDEGVQLGEKITIHSGCVIGKNVSIGYNSVIGANVTLCEGTHIGANCIIHPGVVIGADGFGMANEKGRWLKIPQIGTVHIHDDVEVGANTTIDRGALDDTVIGTGTKIDNQVQIGHNVNIGKHCIIAGCTGVAGSTLIGDYCIIGGGVGIAGHLTITDKVTITGMSMVTKSIHQAGSYSSGIPIESSREWRKKTMLYRQLEKLVQRVKLLEKK